MEKGRIPSDLGVLKGEGSADMSDLNRYAGKRSRIPWHCDSELLLGFPFEPKVIVSRSLGHSVLFKLRRHEYSLSNSVGSL